MRITIRVSVRIGARISVDVRVRVRISVGMMSVVEKSTCLGFITGLCISYHGGNAVRYIGQGGYFMKDG